MAALRSGAGLVTLAVPDVCQATVAGFDPCYMTVGLESDSDGRIGPGALATVQTLASKVTAVGCGPGMGQTAATRELVEWLATQLAVPLILDADALNVLAAGNVLKSRFARNTGGTPAPRILTPHPGEFRRLSGQSSNDRGQLEQAAQRLAAEWNAVIVLKGAGTLITDGAGPK